MADTISAQQLMFNSFTPKVSNRFILSVGDIPSFICKKVTRPGITFGEVVIDHINTKRKLQGKADWNDITMTLWDPIVPSGAQHVMEWVRKGYESTTGAAGYPDFYKEDVTFEVLGPQGDIQMSASKIANARQDRLICCVSFYLFLFVCSDPPRRKNETTLAMRD